MGIHRFIKTMSFKTFYLVLHGSKKKKEINVTKDFRYQGKILKD